MFCIDSMLVLFGIVLLGQARLVNESNCSEWFSYEDLCFQECPTGLFDIDKACWPGGKSFFDLGLLGLEENAEALSLSSVNQSEGDLPILTSTRGLFFQNSSKVSFFGPEVFSYKLTINLNILILRKGDLFSDSNHNLDLISKTLNHLRNFEDDLYGKWNQIHIQVEFLLAKNVKLKLEFGKTQLTKSAIIEEFPNLDSATLILGDFKGTNSGFVGFIFKARFFNFLKEPEETLMLNDCLVKDKTWDHCENRECVERLCEARDRKVQTTCFDPDCTACSSGGVGFCTQCSGYLADGFCFSECPLMFTVGASNVCNNDNTILRIDFESTSGISTVPSKFTLPFYSGTSATYVPLRGYYFNTSTTYYSSASFNQFPIYSIQIWVNVVTGNSFAVCFGSTGLTISSSNMYNILKAASVPIQVSPGWNYYQFLQYSEKFINKANYANLQSYYPYTLKITRDNTLLKLNTTIISEFNFDFYNINSNSTKKSWNISTDSTTTILIIDVRYAPFYTIFASEQLNSVCVSGTVSCSVCAAAQIKYRINCINSRSGCYDCYTSTQCTVNQTNYCYKLLGFCYNPCPLYYLGSYFKCNLESVYTMVFTLNTLNGTVPDSIKYGITLDTNSKQFYTGVTNTLDPIPSKNRGFFFGRVQKTTMKSSQQFIFSPQLFLGLWINPSSYSEIIQKSSVLVLNITQPGVGVVLTNLTNVKYYIQGTTSVASNTWQFIGISLAYDSLSNTVIDIYVNSVKQTYTVTSKIIMDTTNFLVIGGGSTTYFNGWIYKVIYSAIYWTQTEVNSEFGTCTGCTCPKSLNTCIPACSWDEYYSFNQCKKCTSGTACNSLSVSSLCFDKDYCTVCDDFSTCKQCSVSTCRTSCDQACQTCSSPSIINCDTCASSYYSYLDVCVPKCPDLTTVVGTDCTIGSTTTLNYNFHTNANTVTDSLNKVVFESSSKFFYPKRGWHSTSLITSKQNFTLSPYPSFFIWIKLFDYGQVFSKVDGSGDVDFKLNLKSYSRYEILQKTSNGLITYTDVGINGVYPFHWKYYSIFFESGSILSKSYFYIDISLVRIFQLNEQYIISNQNAYFQIGNSSPFWIYSFTYSVAFSPSAFSSTYKIVYPCMLPSDFTGCLWECPLNQYLEGLNCYTCVISSSCQGPLYSDFVTCYLYLNEVCTNKCPTLFTSINTVCTLGSEFNLYFSLDSINGVISSANGLAVLSSPSTASYPNFSVTDPKPGFNRGFYFNNSWLQTSQNLIFSNQFTFEVWANFYSLSKIVSKSRIELGLASSAISLKIVLQDSLILNLSQPASILLNEWNYIGIVLTSDRKVQVYLKNILLANTNTNGYFLDADEALILGGQLSDSFKGWIYRLKYSAKALQSSELIINVESTPVLWNCIFGYYNQSNSCVSCNSQCNCRRSTDCTLCKAENCQLCSSYTSTCTQCFEGYEYFQAVDECRICSPRCINCKFYLDECTSCKTGFVKSDNTCMLYCSNGESLSNGQCIHTDSNIMSFVFNKVYLPYTSNGFELSLGTESRFWPDYDQSDPRVLNQRGFYFSNSLVEVITSTGSGYLQLSNKQTFEMYFFAMQGQGLLMSYYSGTLKMASVSLSGTTINITCLITDAFKSTELFVSSSIELNKWIRLMWTVEVSLHEIKLKAYLGTSAINLASASNNIFDQQLNGKLFLGSYMNANYFKGYIYSVSIENYVKSPQNDYVGCTCPYCTVSGDCLVNCGPLQYMNTTCQNCLSKCTNGCGQGITCSVFNNALCSSFNYLNQECENCIYGAKFIKRPCECVDNGYHSVDDSQCKCSIGQFLYINYPSVTCEFCNLGKTCNGILYTDFLTCFTYLNGVCTDNCPSLFSNISSVCSLGSQENLDFLFDTPSGSINSTNGLAIFNNPSSSDYPNLLVTDPKPGFKRGFYFNDSWLQTSQNLVFSNQFTLEIWVNFYGLGKIIKKSRIELGLGSLAITIKINLLDNIIFYYSQEASIFLFGWNYIGFVLTSERIAQIYLKNNFLANINTNGYFLDAVETLKLGGVQTESFKGWIYRLKYSAKALQSDGLLINTESSPALWNCEFGYFREESTCVSCKNQCNCRRSTDCTLCNIENCQSCSSYTSTCTQCFDGFEYYQAGDECKICSPRCTICNFYLDECTSCKTGFVKSDNTCMLYCSNGDSLSNGQCIHTDSNIMSFVLNKVSLPYTSNGFELKLGTESKFWPDYDLLDPRVLPQRGFFFSKSLVEVITSSSSGFLQLSNTQTFELYFFAMQGLGTLLSFYAESEKLISVTITGNTLSISYQVIDSLISSQLNTAITIQLNMWIRLMWTLKTSNHQILLNVYNGPTLVVSASSQNSVFNQLQNLVFMLGSYKKFDNFRGYIYSFSIDNYARLPQNDIAGCTCSFCTVSGDCLINCGPQEYMTDSCQKCLTMCTDGCGQGMTCSIFNDPLCSSFNFLNNPCLTCISGAITDKRPCECAEITVFNPVTNICECPTGTFFYQGKCDHCYKYLKPNEVSAYFLSNFIQLFLNFTIRIIEVKCEELFQPSTLAKLGQGYTCVYGKDDTSLIVTMGTGFTLLDEQIKLNFINVIGFLRECGNPYQDFDVKVFYSVNPPKPVAIIKSNNPVDINCQDLNIDGSQSTGQLLTGLLYKWEFTSSIPDLQNYPKDLTSNSYVQLARAKLKSEVLIVTLTVYNRFKLQGSTTISLNLTDKSSLVVEFDKSVDYSCSKSQTCQFFIKKVDTCEANPIFTYTWKLVNFDSILDNNKLNSDNIIISGNLFPYSELELLVTVSDQVSKQVGLSTLTILIKPDPLSITLDKSSGTISDSVDLEITPSVSISEDLNTTISYEWSCFLNDIPCSFPFDKISRILTVSKSYLRLRLVEKLTLKVVSTTIIQGKVQSYEIINKAFTEFKCDIVSGSVPSVSIFESKTLSQPKYLSGQSSKIFLAVLEDSDYISYSFNWKIDSPDTSVFVSPLNQVTVEIDMLKLNPGSSYQLSIELNDMSEKNYVFYYGFTVNTPPVFGICNVQPESGEEIKTLFIISCADWEDIEENYPLVYSFGAYISQKPNFFVVNEVSSSYSTSFSYTSPTISVFARISDSLQDSAEVIKTIQISISNTFDASSYLADASTLLNTSLTTAVPNTLLNLALAVLNRDLFTQGGFSEPTNSSLETMNSVYTLINDKLDSFMNSSLPSSDLINQVSGILQEVTKNPSLVSDNNFGSTSSIILNLLELNKDIPLSVNQTENLLASVMNSIVIEPKTLYNKTDQIKSLENIFASVGNGLTKSISPNKITSVSSGGLSLSVMSFDKSSKVKEIEMKVGGYKSTLPPEVLSKFADLSQISISAGKIDLIVENASSTPTATIISVSSKINSKIIPIFLEKSLINIKIQVNNTKLLKKPTCFYLNSTNQWDQSGCSVIEVGEDYIICGCNHLSLFSSGEGVKGGGFVPSSNIEQTVDISELSSINAKSAIGFYFVSVVMGIYALVGLIAWRKDSKDLRELIEEVDTINVRQVIGSELSDVEGNYSQNSMVNEAQIMNVAEINPRLIRNLTLKTEEVKKSTKTGFKVVLEEHRLLNIFFHRDPHTFRFTRCSLLFLIFIGKMFFIGLFYEKETKNSKVKSAKDALLQYTLRDFLVMVYSVGIVISLDLILSYVTKIKVIDLSLPREVILKNIRFNKIKRIISLVFCWGIMGYYCWSIAMFALNLEYSVSMKWILNTALGICSDLTITPLLKLIIKGFIISKLILYFKLRKINRSAAPLEEKSEDGAGLIK